MFICICMYINKARINGPIDKKFLQEHCVNTRMTISYKIIWCDQHKTNFYILIKKSDRLFYYFKHNSVVIAVICEKNYEIV